MSSRLYLIQISKNIAQTLIWILMPSIYESNILCISEKMYRFGILNLVLRVDIEMLIFSIISPEYMDWYVTLSTWKLLLTFMYWRYYLNIHLFPIFILLQLFGSLRQLHYSWVFFNQLGNGNIKFCWSPFLQGNIFLVSSYTVLYVVVCVF